MKYVLLNSGGTESYMLAKHFDSTLIDGVDELHSVYINFELPNDTFARQCALSIADMYCSSHTILSTNLRAEEWAQPKITPVYFDTTTDNYVSYYDLTPEQVEAYNVNRLIAYPYLRIKLMLEGMAFARIIGADVVAGGQNMPISKEWADAFTSMINYSGLHWTSLAKQVIIETPFAGLSTQEIMALTKTTVEDLQNTVSCQEETPCGVCQACKKRVSLGLMEDA